MRLIISRVENPTVTNLEQRVKALTGAENVIALNSGMAAISKYGFFSVVEQGKNVITSRHLFGNTYSLLTSTLSRLGVEARLCDLTDVESVERLIDDNTCCLFLEIMTNPQLEVVDVRALAEIAHRHSIPCYCRYNAYPHSHGSLQRTWELTWRSFQVRSISVVVQLLWAVLLLIMVRSLLLVSAS